MSSAQNQPSKPVHILDFPSETLAQIFGYLRVMPYRNGPLNTGAGRYPDGSSKDIKTIRLVCQRFYGASSHLLLPIVSVSMTRDSLARLDQISRSPLIARGVREVQVNLAIFASNLANFLHLYFMPHQWNQISHVAYWESHADGGIFSEWDRDAEIEAATKCAKLQISWTKLSLEAPNSELDDADQMNIITVLCAYGLYQQAYFEQEQMRSDGSFSRAIADSVARMPAARSLCFDDSDSYTRPRAATFAELIQTPDLMIEEMVQPLPWSALLAPGNEIPSELLSQIPLAIHRAGVMLTDVEYRIAPIGNFSRLVSNDTDLDGLKASMQQLKSFTFRPKYQGHLVFYEDEMEPLNNFLRAFIDTDSIQDISIHVKVPPSRIELPVMGTGSLLSSRSWPRLQYVHFEGPLHLTEIRGFFAKAQTEIILILESVYLMSGSWADLLDVMRTNTQQGNTVVINGLCGGAECDTMSGIAKSRIFYLHSFSLANRYILGVVPFNPLRYIEMFEG